MQATLFVTDGENKHRRSDRNRPVPANSQMILFKLVGRSQMCQGLLVHIFLLVDVTKKNQN